MGITRIDNKQTRACDCCGDWKRYSYFYKWKGDFQYLTGDWAMIVCIKCAKREAGSKKWESVK